MLPFTPDTFIPSFSPISEAALEILFCEGFSCSPRYLKLFQNIHGSFCQIKTLWDVLIYLIYQIWHSVISGSCLKLERQWKIDILNQKSRHDRITRDTKEDFQTLSRKYQKQLDKCVQSKGEYVEAFNVYVSTYAINFKKLNIWHIL